MKKLLALLIAAVLVMALVPAVSASGELPFELKAPLNPTVRYEGEGSGTTLDYNYGMDNAMMSFFKALEDAEDNAAFLSAYPFDEIWMTTQVDWAIDDVNDPVSGWHYTQYWDGGENGIGHDEDYNIRVSEWDCTDSLVYPQASNDVWVLRGMPNDDRWNGNPDTHTPGVKEQLNPDQYSFDYENDVGPFIDYTKHTAYLRSRFVITTRTWDEAEDKYYYSDWSETAAYGRDAEAVTFDESTMEAPTITNLRLADYDFNGYPVVLLTLTVTDAIAKNITALNALGGDIWVQFEGRVKGDLNWAALDGDGTVRSGEVEVKLQRLAEERGGIAENDEVEIRAQYYFDHPETGVKYTDWSNVISYTSDNVTVPTAEPIPDWTEAMGEEDDPTESYSSCLSCLNCITFVWTVVPLIAAIVIRSKLRK